MSKVDERFLVYTALAMVCSTAGVFLGLAAGVWSFIQIAAIIELAYLAGAPKDADSSRSF